MRILYITPYVPNPLRTRPFFLLKTLASRHHITLLTPLFNATEEQDARQLANLLPALEVYGVNCSKKQAILAALTAPLKGMPLQARYCYNPLLVAKARLLLKEAHFDLVHVEHFRAAYFGAELADCGVPLVFDAVDCISLLVERTLRRGALKNRLLSRIELNATRKYEADLLTSGNFKAICATSGEDATALQQLAGKKPYTPVQVIANGVDTDYFAPPATEEVRQPHRVIFSGKMSYHANSSAARYLLNEIWQRVRMECPDATLWIAGSNPPADIAEHNGKHGVTVTGYVDDLRPYLQQASVAVAPLLYSVGIQNKVLEAMACATPVIAHSDVSRAITAAPDEEIILVEANQPEVFARRIIELLNNRQQVHQIGQSGRAFVMREHNWQSAAQRLEKFWSKAVGQAVAVA